jgi:phosphate-selective porin OprO/OprP
MTRGPTRSSAGLVGLLLLSATTAPAVADDRALVALLEVLRDRGSISAAEYRMVLAAADAESVREAADDARLTEEVVAAREAVAAMPRVETGGKLRFTTADGRDSIRIGGRLHQDATWWIDDDDIPYESGQEFRRGRLYASGTIDAVWDWKFQFDFTDLGTEPQSGIEDAYVRYSGFEDTEIAIGQMKAPFSLEELESSKYMPFIERAAITDATSSIVGNRRAGLHATRSFADAVTLSGAVTANRVGQRPEFGGEYAVTGRITFSPVHEDGRVLHLGAAAGWRKLDEGLRVRARPEIHLAGRPVDTDFVPADDVRVYGFDAALVRGPLALQGEYVTYDLDETVPGSGDGDGWYLSASWFPTGESRRYDWKGGTFTSTKVISPVGDGGMGAWELIARFGTIDLDDSASVGLGNDGGGSMDNLTLGVNWYVNDNVMFRLNWLKTLDCSSTCEDGHGAPTDAEPSAVTLRSAVFF